MPERNLDRRSIRLKEYDYTQPGAYFVTIVTQGRLPLFGEIAGEEMQVNLLGRLVQNIWNTLPAHFAIQLDAFMIMPNHIHGILWLGQNTSEIGDSSSPRILFHRLKGPSARYPGL